MKLLSLLTGLLTITTSFTSNSLSDRLCKGNEEIIFSFLLTKNKKIVSLCKDKQGDYLVYRFGTKEKVELEYPQKLDKTSWKVFKLYGVKRFGGKANAGFGDYNISFSNNGVTYEVFENWSDDDDTSDIGVNVTIDKKKVILKGDIKSKQGALLRLDGEQDKIRNTADDEE
ncbi:hypothetical protein FRZ67_20440 [Panacibacter ginsenosidivorans]|uniref:Uncharacterized protein n=1 Tax=Panacibacter ginsenosidivorans TaxID=1813871 RepID=A0A5B8VDK5_9BACT|nr:hypothetical protein [Panacibacter ginsenosidivorans]QEC69554.1 hypothetical protein FRZ67_20440 [Panacibacter ginsenosidivorans]